MGRFNPRLIDRIELAYYVFSGTKNAGIFTMNCPYCGGIHFVRDSIEEETILDYQAVYTCKKCGHKIGETQSIIDDKEL